MWLNGEQTDVWRTISVLETLICSPFNHTTRLLAREYFSFSFIFDAAVVLHLILLLFTAQVKIKGYKCLICE
jgi:hypothetical protein